MTTPVIERMAFGRTGHNSTRVLFGAAALGGMSQSRADQTLALIRDRGVNHIDTAASYGESELRLQPFLADHRAEFFLATKTGERTASGARRELELSLQRLGVDQVDLIQLHNLVEPDELEVAHGAGGAVEALVAARDEGLVRFIGVTGHGTRIADMHLQSLARFDFDSVLLPYNFTMMQNAAYAASFEELATLCASRNVAVQTIKAVARRRWPESSTDPHYSWYEALPAGDALARGVAFVLNRPGVFLNTTSDARLLPAALDAAVSGAPMPTPAALEADVADFDMAPLFDGSELERI
jgi:aryl-alcohol dehydrogenase-like predicted oxidoreductase